MTDGDYKVSRPKEDIYHELIIRKGKEHQIRKLMEECQELLDAGEKYLENMNNSDAEEEFLFEAADVKITVEQIPMIFSAEVFNPYYLKKLTQLDLRLQGDLI